LLDLQQVPVKVVQRFVLGRGAGQAKLLPVGKLGHHPVPLVADGRGSPGEVVPKLAVPQRGPGGVGERQRVRPHLARCPVPADRLTGRPVVVGPEVVAELRRVSHGRPPSGRGFPPRATPAFRTAAATECHPRVSGRSCRGRTAPRLRCPAHVAPCRPLSPPTPRRSSPRTSRRSRSTPPRRADPP